MDNVIGHLNKTTSFFMIMILTVLIIPPLSVLVVVQVVDPPFVNEDLLHEDLRAELGLPDDILTEKQKNLLKERIASEMPLVKPPQLIITVISLAWLGIGIRQWFVISKWNKKYNKFKEERSEVDKKLEEDEPDE